MNKNKSLSIKIFKELSKSFFFLLIKHLRSHAVTWVLVISIYLIIHENYRLAINQTPSLPYTLFIIELNHMVKDGGYVAFKWHNGEPYPNGYTFIKRLVAKPGETVTRKGTDFIIGDLVLVGKNIGLSKINLYPNKQLKEGENIIPFNKIFVAGDHEYSLDSRYSLLGLVDNNDIIGNAYPIF